MIKHRYSIKIKIEMGSSVAVEMDADGLESPGELLKVVTAAFDRTLLLYADVVSKGRGVKTIPLIDQDE